MFSDALLADVRDRFAHVDSCPKAGPRVFFENAGGALTLKSAVETSTYYAAIPDNQGRDNEMAHDLVDTINRAKDDMRVFFNAPEGDIFVGESGTELLFRLIMNAILGAEDGGVVLGSTLEHPATRSACTRWANIAGKPYVQVPHNHATGTVAAADFEPHLTPDIRVATILHTSPVTGMAVDVAGIAAAIRAVAPKALIIVDGIQHASHGRIDIAGYDIDGYVISPYKVFSRHGYGVVEEGSPKAVLFSAAHTECEKGSSSARRTHWPTSGTGGEPWGNHLSTKICVALTTRVAQSSSSPS